jgi:hypothetical protein
MSVELSRSELLESIKIHQRQKDVAKQREEYDVVQYHQREIDILYVKLSYVQK